MTGHESSPSSIRTWKLIMAVTQLELNLDCSNLCTFVCFRAACLNHSACPVAASTQRCCHHCRLPTAAVAAPALVTATAPSP